MRSTKDLIGEVAKRHGVLLTQDDPALMIVTLNELVLQDYVEVVATALREQQAELAATSARTVADSRDLATGLINRSADYIDQRIRAATDEAVAQIRAGLPSGVEQQSLARAPSSWWQPAAIAIAALLIGMCLGIWLPK